MDILSIDLIDTNISFETKEEVFKFVSEKIHKAGIIDNPTSYYDALVTREKSSSTALGNSFAIPHGISDDIKNPAVGIIKLSKPLLWVDESDDPLPDELINCIFYLAIPSSKNVGVENLHVEILSKICCSILDDSFCEKVLKETDANELYNHFKSII